MSTPGPPASGRKRDSSQAGDYVPNQNPQEGWTGPPGSSRVRIVASTSTDTLERVGFFAFTFDCVVLTVRRSEVKTKPCYKTWYVILLPNVSVLKLNIY